MRGSRSHAPWLASVLVLLLAAGCKHGPSVETGPGMPEAVPVPAPELGPTPAPKSPTIAEAEDDDTEWDELTGVEVGEAFGVQGLVAAGDEPVSRDLPPRPEKLEGSLSVAIQEVEGPVGRSELERAGKVVAAECTEAFGAVALGRKIVVQFTVDAMGRVPVAAVSQDTAKRRDLARCLVRLIKAQQFSALPPEHRAIVFLAFSG